MGGAGAPDSLEEGPRTQVWLAVSQDPAALKSGHHFYHQHLREVHPAASDPAVQEKLLSAYARLSGIPFPA
jgi:hypothetical protein